MKKTFVCIAAFLCSVFCLSGCGLLGEKSSGLSVVYCITFILSLVLLAGYCVIVKRKSLWFILLFSSVAVVNAGYLFLSLSTSLEMALTANRVAYLGSVFLPMAMLMIILNVVNIKPKKAVVASLFVLGVLVFLVTASPGILDIYYKEVSFATENGVSHLIKVYGPLHPMYLLYLVGYFASMVAVIISASAKKLIDNAAHAVIIAIAVFVNIGVWFLEQLFEFDFEFLSVSYIISELFLLGVHLVVNENQRLKELVEQKENALRASEIKQESENEISGVTDEAADRFELGLKTLTPTERAVLEAYLSGATTKEVMRELNIKENTVKFHNKNIYSKLGVSSRKQLLELYRSINGSTNE